MIIDRQVIAATNSLAPTTAVRAARVTRAPPWRRGSSTSQSFEVASRALLHIILFVVSYSLSSSSSPVFSHQRGNQNIVVSSKAARTCRFGGDKKIKKKIMKRRCNINSHRYSAPMDQTTITGKRKSAGEAAAEHHDCIVVPRSISCKIARKSYDAPPRPVSPPPRVAEPATEACFATLPRELLYNVVAYLGPTSSSLCALARVTRDHNAIMKTVGDVMLERAKLRFRTPMPPRSEDESSISLFVRHARVSKAVHDKLELLHRVLRKGLPDVNTASAMAETKFSSDLLSDLNDSDPESASRHLRAKVEPSEVKYALNVALCLLGCWKQHCFVDPHEAHGIATNAATTALEWRISSLCSILGAKAYKYAKSRIVTRMCRRYGQEDDILSACVVTDEMLCSDGHSDYEDDDEDLSIGSAKFDDDEDMTILDMASLVMEHVYLRKKQKLDL